MCQHQTRKWGLHKCTSNVLGFKLNGKCSAPASAHVWWQKERQNWSGTNSLLLSQVLHAGKLRRWLGGRKRESFQPQTRCLFPQCCCFQGLHLEQVKAHTQSDFQVLHVYAALPPLKSIQGETVTSEGAKYKSLQRDQRSVASKRIASPSVLVGCQKRKKTGDLRGREKKKRFTVD